MLLGFKVKNFKSFKDLQYFSMLASKVRLNENHITEIGKYKILNFSEIFGANGSGKSNLILAISMLKTIVNSGVDSLINNLYYRGSKSGKLENSYFEYEITLNNKFYSYGFELNIFKREIVSEWLIDMSKTTQKVIYERDIVNEEIKTDIKKPNIYFINCLKELKSNKNELFIKEMLRRLVLSSNEDPFFDEIISVFKYLIYDMIIIRPSSHKLLDFDYLKNSEKVLNILKALDINIVNITTAPFDMESIERKLNKDDFLILKNEVDTLSLRNKNSYTLRINNDLFSIKKNNDGGYEVNSLKFIHKNSKETFGAYDESDGTIRIIELMDILITENKLYLIDELESSLHPKLVIGLLKLFLNSKNNNQLIITTHEAIALNFNLVRRDEIWFTEKDDDGASRLYSLEEFKDVARFDKKIDKAYMEGRFGAIANIDIDYEN